MVTFGCKLSFTCSLLLPAPAVALAAGIRTQSFPQDLWHDDPFQDKNRGDILQSMTLGVTKIDASCQISTVGGGRVCFR